MYDAMTPLILLVSVVGMSKTDITIDVIWKVVEMSRTNDVIIT
jgi:hypothetical protein